MIWIESKYANLLNSRVRNFKRKSATLWNFSCPLCGDSETNSKKARGYIYETSGKLRYHCHKCSVDMKFDKFIREIDESLFVDMKKEQLLDFKENNKPEVVEFAEKMKKPEFVKRTTFSELKKVSQLSPSHYCKRYIDNRKIPTTFHHQLFFADKFKEWTNTMLPGKFDPIKYEEARLVIPFLDSNKHLFGYQGRSLDSDNANKVKYITIMLDEDHPRIYGLDRVDYNRRYYCLEGPFDCMFVDNSIASCGADIVSEVERLKSNKDNAIIVYDNEPRNKDTVKKINKAIRKGFKVVIWPDSVTEKDINEMVLAGLNTDELIKQNIYTGLQAELRMAQWRKV